MTGKMLKMIKTQTVLSLLMAIIVCVFSLLLSTSYFGLTIVSFIIAAGMAWLLIRAGIYILTIFLQFAFYRGDFESLAKDSVDALTSLEAQLNKVKNPEPALEKVMIRTDAERIGTFQDHPFYEWIEIVEDDGSSQRFNYFGTMDISKGIKKAIPIDCVLIPPGILYQQVQKI